MARKTTELTHRRAHWMARAVLAHHLDAPPSSTRAKGGGLTNFVFESEYRDEAFIVRIGRSPEKLNAYLKEQWAMKRAKEIDVPTPDVLEVGNDIIGSPYMVLRKVSGEPGLHHARTLDVLREMGACTARIHTIRTSGFGSTFDWSSNRLSHHASWKDYLDRELKTDWRMRVLRDHQMLDGRQLRNLKAAVRDIEGWREPSVLSHGDMRLKNVIVSKSGILRAVLDWEDCVASSGPSWDLSLALHDLSIDEKEAFLEGYGLEPQRLREMSAGLWALNVLNYAPQVHSVAQARDQHRLDQYRTRLSGALNLF